MTSLVHSENINSGKLFKWPHRIKSVAFTHGLPYLTAWAQRISGVILVLYVLFHILTLSSLHDAESFDAKMKVLGFFLFAVLEWVLGVPVIFHSLNGARIVLYEAFENRRDDLLLKYVFGAAAIYLILLAVFMALGNQQVSAVFFWVYFLTVSVCVTFFAFSGYRNTGISIFWKIHRITGVLLMTLVPAHMVFMHLNPLVGHDAQTILSRLGNPFIQFIDLLLLFSVLYHGGYGLFSLARDYVPSGAAKTGVAILLACTMFYFAWTGAKLILFVG